MILNNIGPNVRRLIAERMSQLAVERAKPHADPGPFGLVSAMAADLTKENLLADARAASAWVEIALRAIRTAPGGEIYASDEEAAAELLRLIAERRQSQL